MTEPRYPFTSCDYRHMDDETKELFHQLVNAVGDRAKRERKCAYCKTSLAGKEVCPKCGELNP